MLGIKRYSLWLNRTRLTTAEQIVEGLNKKNKHRSAGALICRVSFKFLGFVMTSHEGANVADVCLDYIHTTHTHTNQYVPYQRPSCRY